jgi:protein-L-isoaspartate(D-aspartate) O-methyltransferase
MISKRTLLLGAVGLCVGAAAAAAEAPDAHASARTRLLAEIQSDLRDSASSTGRRQLEAAVLAAIAKVPRHRFVPPPWAALAYSNRPLPIGHGQTISQPFIVALMTQSIDPKPTDRVLEIGTGSGYQAAVLAELVARVHTIEIVRPLGERAAELLRELGYANVDVRIGDGYLGWPEAAPFDAIVVTAAPDKMPQPLIDQLAPGGRLIAPIGPAGGIQTLLLMRKDPDGRTVTRHLLPVRFVPLTRN